LFKAAAAKYQQGNWASATRLNHRALTAHTLMAERAGEVDRYPWVSDAALELVTIKALADKLEPAVTNLVDHAVTDPRIQGLFDMATAALTSAGPPWWDGWDVTRHATRIADRLGTAPFADTTGLRRVRFACLDVDWTIEFANRAADVAVGERLAAALQIILAYLAAADPALLPTGVTVHVAAGPPGVAATIEENGSVPGETRFRCVLATATGNRREAAQTVAPHDGRQVPMRRSADPKAVQVLSAAQQQADSMIAQAQDYARRVTEHARQQYEDVLRSAQVQAQEEAERAVQHYRARAGAQYAAEFEELERRLA
jgi:vacuolar-type H+-ATPase subunit H